MAKEAGGDGADARLAESESRYVALIENASDIVQSVLADGSYEFVNPAWHKILGYSEAELEKLSIWDVIHPESMEHCQPIFMRVMEGENLPDVEFDFQAKDGSRVPVRGNATPRISEGKVLATHSFFRDMREHDRAEELEKRTEQLERDRIAQHLEKMAALGKLSAGLAHELNNPAAAAVRSVDQIGESIDCLTELAARFSRSGVDDEQWNRLQTVLDHFVEKIQSQDDLDPLEQTEREDVLGDWLEEMGADDPWDLAEPLVRAGVDAGELEAMFKELPADGRRDAIAWVGRSLLVADTLMVLRTSVASISDLVGAVKAYSYMDQAAEQEVDIHEGLENTLKILSYKLTNVTLTRNFDRSVPTVQVFGSELNQVWTNIIDNAIDAMDGSGSLVISTSLDDGRAVVEILDDGPGIPVEAQSRVFEPFFTTKSQGEGTGLGLNTAWRIIAEEYGGKIELESRPGETRFRVYVPLKGRDGRKNGE